MASFQESVGWLWSWMPSIDSQTIFSLIFGTAVTALLSWLGYRKAIGAKEERIRSANWELCWTVLRRIAVERREISEINYNDLRRAKSYRSKVPYDSLLEFNDSLSISYFEIVDNHFIDPSSKDVAIEILNKSRGLTYMSQISDAEINIAKAKYRGDALKLYQKIFAATTIVVIFVSSTSIFQSLIARIGNVDNLVSGIIEGFSSFVPIIVAVIVFYEMSKMIFSLDKRISARGSKEHQSRVADRFSTDGKGEGDL